jgi:hypothetical protein
MRPPITAARAPDWDSFHLQIFSTKNFQELFSGLLVQSYHRSCGKSAKLYSHGKVTTPRRENRKILHENIILKANAPDV